AVEQALSMFPVPPKPKTFLQRVGDFFAGAGRFAWGIVDTAIVQPLAMTYDLGASIGTLALGPEGYEPTYLSRLANATPAYARQAELVLVQALVSHAVDSAAALATFGALRGSAALWRGIGGRPLGARGPHSGRTFNAAQAGGPVRDLTTRRLRVTERGVD